MYNNFKSVQNLLQTKLVSQKIGRNAGRLHEPTGT